MKTSAYSVATVGYYNGRSEDHKGPLGGSRVSETEGDIFDAPEDSVLIREFCSTRDIDALASMRPEWMSETFLPSQTVRGLRRLCRVTTILSMGSLIYPSAEFR